MKLALITEVFTGADAAPRLRERLEEACSGEASLAVLPELPLDPWVPAGREARDEDAEPPGGPRQEIQADAARSARIGLVGGAILKDPSTGQRYNTALVFDANGSLRARYRKMHIPEENGFWETSHYEPGDDPPRPVDGFELPLGLQICSDVNRPAGSQILGAMGAAVIVAPRCTPLSSYERWKLVLRSNAVTSTAWVISTNRPRPERGVEIGGPSIAVAPDGEVLIETTEPVAVVTLDPEVLRRARTDYPGYLPVRAEAYARAWTEAAGRKS